MSNEFKGASVDAAIEEGLKKLGIEREDAQKEVLHKGGLFKKAVVKIEKRKYEEIENPEESSGKKFIEDILNYMNLNCTVEQREKGEEISFFIKGEDANRIIGHRGETLDALQYLVTSKLLSEGKKYQRVVVDADFYRQKREKTLTNLARRLARKAASTGSEVELEPMTSFERRIIHTALQKNKLATTRSEGQGKDRHIVISPLEEMRLEYGPTSFSKTGPKKTQKFGYKRKRF